MAKQAHNRPAQPLKNARTRGLCLLCAAALAAIRPPLSGVVDRSSCNFNRKILTISLRDADLSVGTEMRRKSAKTREACHRARFARPVGAFAGRDGCMAQLRTVMQEMSERFNVRHTASA